MKRKIAFLNGELIMLKIVGHVKYGIPVGIDEYGRVYKYCEPIQSVSKYDPEQDGPIRFDV